MDKIKFMNQIAIYFPARIQNIIKNLDNYVFDDISEIRLNLSSPLFIEYSGKRGYLSKCGITNNHTNAYIVTKDDILKCFELITKSSVYAYNRYINEGFITVTGGHRIGITGTCVLNDSKIMSVKDINSLNFRISHCRKGVSDIIMSELYTDFHFNNTLIISPPGCGKTTMLKDILCNLSRINKITKCVVVDERFELNIDDVNPNRTSISYIKGCPKKIAIPLAVRSMNPDVIIVDELASNDDILSARYAIYSGAFLIASTHGFDETSNEISLNNSLDMFSKVIVLSERNGPGTIEKILDRRKQ